MHISDGMKYAQHLNDYDIRFCITQKSNAKVCICVAGLPSLWSNKLYICTYGCIFTAS